MAIINSSTDQNINFEFLIFSNIHLLLFLDLVYSIHHVKENPLEEGVIMKILITKDTMSEIYLDAVRIRQKVFVQEQGVPANLEIDGNEAYSVHFVLYTDDKKPAATVRLLPLNDHTFKLQRMAVLKEYRRKNLGSEIITEAEAFAKQQHYKTIELGAQLSAEKFYKKLGYITYGEIFEDAGIDHVHMKKELQTF